jgi:preprotein translocase subunit SecB
MTDETTTASTETQQPQFSIQRIYVKDISFETPQGADAFQKQWKPKVSQDLNTKSKKISDDLYEVVLRVTITMADEDSTLYLIEVEQAGLFTIKGFADQQLPQVINATCPSILFPYLRDTIDNIVTKGSFPALMLPPINFDALYANAVQQAAEEAKNAQGSGSETKH